MHKVFTFTFRRYATVIILMIFPICVFAQHPPYNERPDADPPYYQVRYESSKKPGELVFPVSYTVWIPPDAGKLKGVIVHQHVCGPAPKLQPLRRMQFTDTHTIPDRTHTYRVVSVNTAGLKSEQN